MVCTEYEQEQHNDGVNEGEQQEGGNEHNRNNEVTQLPLPRLPQLYLHPHHHQLKAFQATVF